MTVQTFYVTPSLLVGAAPPGLSNCAAAASLEQALDIVWDDRIAVLPLDGWAIVRDVLSVLGLGPSDIEDRIRFSTTARPSATGRVT